MNSLSEETLRLIRLKASELITVSSSIPVNTDRMLLLMTQISLLKKAVSRHLTENKVLTLGK